MGSKAINKALLSHLENNLPTGITAADVLWPNLSLSPSANQNWLTASVEPVDEDRLVMTGNQSSGIRTTDLLTISVFVPKDNGSFPALSIADELKATFREQKIVTEDGTIIRTRVPRTLNAGPTDQFGNTYYQVEIQVPVYHLN